MIPRTLIEQIEGLLKEQKECGCLNYRAVGRIVGVNRRTVKKVAKGHYRRRLEYQQEKAEREAELIGPVQRCPGCGRKIAMPCRACPLERIQQHRPKMRASDVSIDREPPPGLDLKEPHRRRYEEVRHRRLRGRSRDV
jgi:hypothetical protein